MASASCFGVAPGMLATKAPVGRVGDASGTGACLGRGGLAAEGADGARAGERVGGVELVPHPGGGWLVGDGVSVCHRTLGDVIRIGELICVYSSTNRYVVATTK